MNVNPISTVQSFTAIPQKAENIPDRDVTVKELYESEDRIIEAQREFINNATQKIIDSQKDLIRNQNARIANALKSVLVAATSPYNPDFSTIYSDSVSKINQLQGNIA